MLSRDTLEFLQALLNRTQLPVGDPQWRHTAQRVAKAQDELAAALDAAADRPVEGPRLHPVNKD